MTMMDDSGEDYMTDLSPYLGQWIDHSYGGGLIFLSYFISFVGCWTALELLHRRTSIHGHYNWYQSQGAVELPIVFTSDMTLGIYS